MLFRKVTKGINNKDFIITKQKYKIKQLQDKIVELESKKKKKGKNKSKF
jgi:hypothetical protein